MSADKPNMKDVAQLAGVSLGTVSKYVNGNSNISQSNRLRIREAIEKLRFTPNMVARKLVSGEANSLLMYIVHENPVSTASWLYDLPIIQGITDYFSGGKYSLELAMDPVDNPDKISKCILGKYLEKSITGVLIISPWRMDSRLLIKLIDQNIPYVLIGADNSILHSNQVVMANYDAIQQIMERLYQLGHRRVALISGLPDQYDMCERRRGVVDFVLSKRMNTCEQWLLSTDQTVEGGHRRMKELLEAPGEKPSAIVCGNDYVAAGVVQAIKGAGFTVPGDFSVTGFDNIALTGILNPSLTTVALPVYQLGQQSARMMDHLLNGSPEDTTGVRIPCEVIFRDSVAAAARQ